MERMKSLKSDMTFHYVLQEATALAWFNLAAAAAYNPKLVDAYIDRMMAAIKGNDGKIE